MVQIQIILEKYTVKLGFKELFGHHKKSSLKSKVPYFKHLIKVQGIKGKWLFLGINTFINKKYQFNGPSSNNLK